MPPLLSVARIDNVVVPALPPVLTVKVLRQTIEDTVTMTMA